MIYFSDIILNRKGDDYHMATMSIRLSDSDKKAADQLFKGLGTTTNSAINMFIKQSIRMQSFPFTPSMKKDENFTPSLTKALEESDEILKEIKEGKIKGYKDVDSLFKALDE